MDTLALAPYVTLHLVGGGTIGAYRQQVSYVKGRGRTGATVTVEGLAFDVTESIGEVFRALHP